MPNLKAAEDFNKAVKANSKKITTTVVGAKYLHADAEPFHNRTHTDVEFRKGVIGRHDGFALVPTDKREEVRRRSGANSVFIYGLGRVFSAPFNFVAGRRQSQSATTWQYVLRCCHD